MRVGRANNTESPSNIIFPPYWILSLSLSLSLLLFFLYRDENKRDAFGDCVILEPGQIWKGIIASV
jgi:hypothetical protein